MRGEKAAVVPQGRQADKVVPLRRAGKARSLVAVAADVGGKGVQHLQKGGAVGLLDPAVASDRPRPFAKPRNAFPQNRVVIGDKVPGIRKRNGQRAAQRLIVKTGPDDGLPLPDDDREPLGEAGEKSTADGKQIGRAALSQHLRIKLLERLQVRRLHRRKVCEMRRLEPVGAGKRLRKIARIDRRSDLRLPVCLHFKSLPSAFSFFGFIIDTPRRFVKGFCDFLRPFRPRILSAIIIVKKFSADREPGRAFCDYKTDDVGKEDGR